MNAIDVTITDLDTLADAQAWTALDAYLDQISDGPLVVILAALAITLPHRAHLRGRDRLIGLVEQRAPDRADRLLRGLRSHHHTEHGALTCNVCNPDED